MLDAERIKNARNRLKQVYQFLRALDEHRNPVQRQIKEQPWVESLRHIPDHPSVKFVYPTDGGEPAQLDGQSVILSVRRPEIKNAPPAHEADLQWLEEGWADPFREVRFRASLQELAGDGEVVTVHLDDDPVRVERLRRWQEARDVWAERERPTRKAMRLFERLYGLHGTIEREGEQVDLVLGDGILNWRLDGGGIHHPILLQRAELRFNAAIPEFTVVESEAPVELYTAILRAAKDLDGSWIAKLRHEMEAGEFHPLQGQATSGFLTGLVVRLSAQGEFLPDAAPVGEKEYPRIGREPVLFLRRRTLGFSAAIEAILEDLPSRTDIPIPLLRVIGEDWQSEPPAEDSEHAYCWSEPEEVFLSRDANPEQVRVAERLQSTASVVVQGPPGTGKTHTIANLIGDLLAKGKTVLVTSHTAKALTVLRQKVVPALQPLCISVLGNDVESRRQLERSVEEIIERLSSDATKLAKKATQLKDLRRRLTVEIEQNSKTLADSLESEYRTIVLDGQSIDPSEAARKVQRDNATHSWIPGPLSSGAPLPLSTAELQEVYRSNDRLRIEDEVQLHESLPPLEAFPTPETIRQLASNLATISQQGTLFRADLWEHGPMVGDRECLEALLTSAHQIQSDLASAPPWRLQLIEAGFRGGPYKNSWISLLDEVRAVTEMAAKAQETFYRFGPVLPDRLPLRDQERIITDIINRLSAGGDLGTWPMLFHREWKLFIQESRVAGELPSKLEHFEALATSVRMAAYRKQLVERWDRQADDIGLPNAAEFGTRPEVQLEQMTRLLREALHWHEEVWLPIQQQLTALGFRMYAFEKERPPNLGSTPHISSLLADISKLATVLESHLARAVELHLHEVHESLKFQAASFRKNALSSAVTRDLASAIEELQPETYARAYSEVHRLEKLVPAFKQRHHLLEKLRPVAPNWAQSIEKREGIHGEASIPGDPEQAWRWSQLSQELDRRASVAIEALQTAIEKASKELRRATGELIESSAWSNKISRTTLANKLALMGWRDIVSQMPKTSTVPGKLVRLRREAQDAMRRCRASVPVWIMPFSRVVESFDFRITRFDVAIIDEASQTDIMGLLVHYLARQVVIVGDHEQVSPTPIGQIDQVVYRLIDEHLQGIPNSILYNGKTSIYDLARHSSGDTICLLEHFRCVPQIIQFSNDLCYDGRIKPLRESEGNFEPHVVPYRVEGAVERAQVNQVEAETLASLLVAAARSPQYYQKTMGVVCLVGEAQALEIERLLREHLSPGEYADHKIICGNAAQFQGDERDIVFLSMVDAPGEGFLALRTTDTFRQRFNVAASRAKDQLWVVYSLDPERHLKPGDLRRRLIEHALDPDALVRKLDRAGGRAESEFERLVVQRLIRRGFRVWSQWRVGYYRIDVVVEGNGKRLAIECDGDRYHTMENLHADMLRQATLERLGWKFVRIRGTSFFRDPDAAMAPVFERLDRLGIEPESSVARESAAPIQSALFGELTRKAAALRRKWHGEIDDATEAPAPVQESSLAGTQSDHPPAPRPHNQAIQAGANEAARPLRTPTAVALATSVENKQQRLPLAVNDSRTTAQGDRVSPKRPAKRAAIKKINKVSQHRVRDAIMRHIPYQGRIEREELLRIAMKDLGFRKLGSEVRSRLNRCIGAHVRVGKLGTDWEFVWRPALNSADSDLKVSQE